MHVWTLRRENQFMATDFRVGTDPNAYGAMWRDMIAQAPANLNGFTAARDALGQQAPCQASSS